MAYSRWFGSNWYIFWHANENERDRSTCLLAIWDKDCHTLPYPVVKKMLEDDDWTPIGYPPGSDIPEKDTLVSCVKQWVKDVEETYSSDD